MEFTNNGLKMCGKRQLTNGDNKKTENSPEETRENACFDAFTVRK